jgi:hypothetical protein
VVDPEEAGVPVRDVVQQYVVVVRVLLDFQRVVPVML